jgi:hypothetical protein
LTKFCNTGIPWCFFYVGIPDGLAAALVDDDGLLAAQAAHLEALQGLHAPRLVSGLAIKNPPKKPTQKTHPKNPPKKPTQKNPKKPPKKTTKNVLAFLIFYENNTNFFS